MPEPETIVDADVVPDEPKDTPPGPEPDTPVETPPPAPETGAELVPVAPAAGMIIAAESPAEIITKATEIANALKALIDGQEMAVDVGGRKKHVEVGAWQACGTMLGALGGQPLHAETVWSRIAREPDGSPVKREYHVKEFHSKKAGGGLKREYDVDGYDWEARVEIRTPAGIVAGAAEALCSRAESTWATRPDPAVKSMAETRAESRAYRRAIGWIVHLAGYSATPAEEMPANGGGSRTPAFAEAASDELAKIAKKALVYLAGDDKDVASKTWAKIVDAPANGDPETKIGYMPRIVAQNIVHVAGVVQARVETAAQAAAEKGDDDAPADGPPGTIQVGTPSDEHPDRVNVEKARQICTCPDGFDAAQEPNGRTDGACPIYNHGIPF